MRGKFSRVIIIVLGLVVVAGVGYGWASRVVDRGGVSEIVSEPGGERAGGEEVTDTSDWKTYRNEEQGFSFRYPPCLTVRKSGPEGIELVSRELRESVGYNLYNPPYADLEVKYSKIEDSFNQWKEKQSGYYKIFGEALDGNEFRKQYGGEGLTFYEDGLLISRAVFLLNKGEVGIEVGFTEDISCVGQEYYKAIIESFFQ